MISIAVLVLATLGIAGLAFRVEESWLAPSPFFVLMWAGYLFSVSFFVSDIDTLLAGMLWIALALFVVYLGAVLGGSVVVRAGRRTPVINDGALVVLRRICGAVTLAGVANILSFFVARGLTIGRILSFTVIAQVSAANRADAYAGEADTSLLQRIMFVALFCGCIYGGLLFRLARRRADYLLGAAPLGMIAAIYTMLGSRMGVLYGGAFWIASYLTAHTLVLAGDRRGEVKFLVRLGIAATFILIGLSTLTQVVRYAATQNLDWFRMIADPFSFVAAFGMWFDHRGMQFSNLLYGGRLFRRFFEAFGVSYELQPAIEVGFTSSNIYTVFRDLIEDFNPVGALVFLGIFGFVGRVAFAATVNGRWRAVPWLILIYAFAITSFASGLLSYTTPTAAIALFMFTFRYFPRLTFDRPEAPSAHVDSLVPT